jgi:3-oxoacyl-[acyl-carrier protein] reductase
LLTARHLPQLEQAAREIRQRGGQALALPADLTSARDVQRLAQHAVERLGTVHVLVNNAGGVQGSAQFEDLSDEDWISIFQLNVLSTVRLTRALLPCMRAHHWGRIINIGSAAGIQPDPIIPHYTAAKAAIINLTKSLSKAYGREGILVNTVSTGPIKTPLGEQYMATQAKGHGGTPQQAEQAYLREQRPHMVLRRLGTPEEVTSAVVYLASEAASFITGANLRVDGGSVASM